MIHVVLTDACSRIALEPDDHRLKYSILPPQGTLLLHADRR
jgi:hypothetical protein